VRLEARFQNARQEVVTDAEGYFFVEFEPTGTLASEQVWHPIELRLLEQVVPEQDVVEATGQVLVPPVQSDFGIISDIDDTIIETEVTDFLKMLRVIFFNNAKTRLPFKGVAGFYRALCRGLGNHPAHNPIFYVSGSPWNLYDLLIDFMQTQKIPLGPLFLRDFGLSMDKFIKRSTKLHKLEQIEHILTLYPDLPFILIGDSGEKDPEIYQQVVQDFPGRILTIYIREISLEGRQAEIDLLIEELGKQDVEMVLVPDTEVAALHAVERGFISRDSLADIQTEKSKDETGPSDLEQLLEQV
jgi:phosphatidate phosphatase APP1